VPLPAHHRDDAAGELVPAEEVGLELVANQVGGHVLDGAGLGVAAIVEERVETAVGAPENVAERRLDGAGVGQIEPEGLEPLVLEPLAVVGVARRRKDAPTTQLQPLRSGEADAGRATGNENRALRRRHCLASLAEAAAVKRQWANSELRSS